jgi:hypothetical protein
MKRLFWLTAGAVAGSVGSQWARRKASRVAASYAPAPLGRRLAAEAQDRVRAATQEARVVTAATEARLRQRFVAPDDPWPEAAPPDGAQEALG